MKEHCKTADQIKEIFEKNNYAFSYSDEFYKSLEDYMKNITDDCERYNFITENFNAIEDKTINSWNRKNPSEPVENLTQLKEKLINCNYIVLHVDEVDGCVYCLDDNY